MGTNRRAGDQIKQPQRAKGDKMIKLYIDEAKTLSASKKDGLKLAEIITRKTGKNPKIEELPEKGTKKADVYFINEGSRYEH